MFYFFVYVLIVLSFSLILKLKVYHPVVITHLIWFVVILLYNLIPSKLYPLSSNVYLKLILYLFFFLFGSIFYYIVFGIKKQNYFNLQGIENTTNLLFDFVFFLTSYLFLRYFMMFANGTTLYKEIVQGRLPLDIRILSYFDKLSLVYFFYIITIKKTLLKKQKKIHKRSK